MNRPYHALVIHGLNNTPEMMRPIANRLERLGIGCTLCRLTGHWEQNNRLKLLKQATPETWLKDVEQQYLKMAEKYPNNDFILVGFSMGALLGILLAQSGKASFQKSLLFAPALYLRWWSYLPALLTPFALNLPSATPRSMRANSGTPVSAYNALFALVKQLDPPEPVRRL